MEKEEFKQKLKNYAKDDLIEALFDDPNAISDSRAKELVDTIKRNRIDSLWDQECRADEKISKKKKAYDKYLFEVARKHGIATVDEEGLEDFKWDDWFSVTTKEERLKADSLKKGIDAAIERREAINFRRKEAEIDAEFDLL